jgi:hypothetical protein
MSEVSIAPLSAPLWFIGLIIALWLGFRLSHSMHEGAADARAPNIARALVTIYCLSVAGLLISEVVLPVSMPSATGLFVGAIVTVTTVMQLLQIWTEKPMPGKDCQGRDTVD